MVLDVRYSDRRLERIVEDMQGVSPEGANAGLPNQIYLIGNPSPIADYFINEIEEKYDPAVGPPANCVDDYGTQEDSLGNVIGAACGQNPTTAGLTTPDGKPDGFALPVRRYQSLEVELNKNFSRGFLIRANYRFAKLWGNYEGLFRNDNGQSDPGISSLFDFTQGVVGLLGAQFQPGYLNTDRRNVGNLYGSYSVSNGLFRKLTGGIGLRGQTGTPISRLASHPVYENTGEIPIGGRGTAGTTPTTMQLDTHLDYPISFGDKGSLKTGIRRLQRNEFKVQYRGEPEHRHGLPDWSRSNLSQSSLFPEGVLRTVLGSLRVLIAGSFAKSKGRGVMLRPFHI